MDYISKVQQKAKNQKINAPKLIGDLIIINSPNIIKDVRKRWLIGESVLGGFIGDYSSSQMGQDYRAYKMSINPRAKGQVDLTLTGALGAGLTVKKATSTDFKIFSVDSKYQMIGNKYGFDEFGLSDLEWYEMQAEILTFAIETAIKRTYE